MKIESKGNKENTRKHPNLLSNIQDGRERENKKAHAQAEKLMVLIQDVHYPLT